MKNKQENTLLFKEDLNKEDIDFVINILKNKYNNMVISYYGYNVLLGKNNCHYFNISYGGYDIDNYNISNSEILALKRKKKLDIIFK